MGRMDCYIRDAYHVGKPATRLAHVNFYLFTFYIFNSLSDRSSFTGVLAFVSFRIIILSS